MQKTYDPFIANYPVLDLHGEYSTTILFLINDFINDNIKLKKENILIIHGKGKGIIRNRMNEILSTNKFVVDYKLHTNLGSTIVRLKIDK